jgi:predicted transposase/invertase (TIGR01784 family)
MFKQRYVNPFTDFGFKKLFGEEAHKHLLVDFLNALLPAKHQISDLEYTKNEATGDTTLDRRAIFDIACTGTNGERFIVELQKAKQNFFKDRSVFYATFPIREQAERGEEWNFELAAVYCIGILDFVFDDESDDANDDVSDETSDEPRNQAASTDYLHLVQLKNQRNTVFYDKLTFVYLEMPKFTKTEAQLASRTDKWLYFIKHVSRLEGIPAGLQEQIFEQAFRTAEIAQFTQSEARQYEASLKYYRDLKNVMDTAIEEATTKSHKKGLQKGMQKGMQKGLREGRKKGREEGIKEGTKEGRKKGREEGIKEGERRKQEEIARNLRTLGVALADIAAVTGLSAEEIANL